MSNAVSKRVFLAILLYAFSWFPQINLKLILVSGKTAEFQFPPVTTASDVAKHVYENWPEGEWSESRDVPHWNTAVLEWADEHKVERYEVLRLIYQGRFLHGNVTLGALRLQQGKTTVMHLVSRENLPESSNGEPKKKHRHAHNPDGTADTTQGATSRHSSPTEGPNGRETRGCCDSCSIL